MNRLIRLLYPPKCPFCEKLLQGEERLICGECRRSLPYAGAAGKQSGRFYTLCVSPLFYRDKAREALLRFKFGSRSGSAAAFGSLIADRVDRDLAGEYDLITWVPVSLLRLRRRGFSQSRLLAEETARLLEGGNRRPAAEAQVPAAPVPADKPGGQDRQRERRLRRRPS